MRCTRRFARIARATAITATLSCAACGGTDWQTTVEEVIARERAFSARATDTTVQQAFLEAVAEDAVLFRPAPTDARTALAAQPFPPGLRLEWAPAWADASTSGDLGYTTGPWRSGRRDDPTAPASHGWYVTLRQRRSREGWRAILDFGTAGGSSGTTDPSSPAVPGSPAVHQDSASLAHSIRLVDEDFVEAASADSAAIEAFVSPETRFLRDGATAGVGFDALAHAYTARERTARWAMASQGVARTGDLGFAYGTWRTPETDDAHSGAWLRIWRRDPAGDWKLALDAVSGSRSSPFP